MVLNVAQLKIATHHSKQGFTYYALQCSTAMVTNGELGTTLQYA